MIDKFEIDGKAKEFEIHRANVERDYVFGWLLHGFFVVSSLKDEIFLKGGNALRKGYFEQTRYSRDLDFGIPGDINPEVLLSEINKICDYLGEKTQILFVKEDNRIEEKFSASETPIPGLKVYEARVYFKDFYDGNTEHLKIKISMDITRFDRTMLPIQTVKLIHPYSDADSIQCEIRCMKLEEIIATKLKCLLQRQHAPDLFDYVYTIQTLGGDLNKEEVVRTLVQKTIFSRNPHVLKDILLKTSFDYFREFWSKSLICAKQAIFGVETAISAFLKDVEGLFSIFSNNGYAAFAFFGPELRVPIMKAGRSQTLLKIRYKGEDRIVEPYSLKYLERRDGVAREYLYVYKVSGGSSSPGIRCLVAENFSSIENTDEKFEPRNVIELSKAGEKPENPYLFDPNKPMPQPRQKISRLYGRSRPTLKYTYQCTYCGKKFTKTRQSSVLNPHKTKTGYPCSGRSGFYVKSGY